MPASPDQHNRSLRCDYHRDHYHETNQCQSLKFLVEKLIQAGHLKRFIREPSHETETAPITDRAIVATEHPLESRPAINYVLGGPIDDQYQSKKKRRKMLRAAKRGGKWRVCVDYMDLNDACPKDSFPLPRIDQIVDASAGYGMLSFLDAFSGYHQILMYPPDVEKTSFITPHGLYCYNVMPLGLKNVGATYQRLVTEMFRPLLGKIMEVYIDDMLIKSKEWPDHATHLQQVFDFLITYSMKLNPVKCAFGVNAGRFLGFMMTQRGIEANPSYLKDILESLVPSSRKEVQRLAGRLAALGRFISRFTDRLKPFFTALRVANQARWNEECD